MDVFERNGVKLIDIGNQRPEHYWVFELVMNKIDDRLNLVAGLDRFHLRQLMGEETWQHLTNKKQHLGAGRCFAYIVESGLFGIEQVLTHSQGPLSYKVK